ncbi:MAG TPA: DMT family transporter [Hypericibacter adhaerens]|jgi:drug/metabolite transporter (DMT)-like permease|uniref:DMT family transporter n=1 Tax=Hypericibacter adhaerens TaxID=2602016 RepID=UPI002CF0CD9E|nr:DMT family transporter [Hypericibacter adhaerens]HWA43630.1 DMT family transporter [Hypericibacter adhaerens]
MSSTALPAARPSVMSGIGLMVLAVLLFTTMDMLVKLAAERFPIGQIVFVRNFFAFLPVTIMILRSGGWSAIRTRNPLAHLLRSGVGILSMACYFLSYALLPLGEAVSLASSGPLFMTALSVPLLGEKVGPRRWSAVVVGFVGVLVMMRPGSGLFQAGALVAIAAAFCYALAVTQVRRLSRTEGSTAIVFYFTLFATIAGAASLPFDAVMPTWSEMPLLVAIGLIGGVAQFAFTAAFRRAAVAIIAPFDYLGLVFAMIYGFLVWGEVPDAWLIAGAAIVVASGLYIVHREAVVGRRHRAALASG